MSFWGDYHTHTIYSHGKGTIEENVVRALKSGLKEIAITDHGFRHMTYNVRRMVVKARHISYQLNFITVSPFATTSCTGALAGLENHAAGNGVFKDQISFH